MKKSELINQMSKSVGGAMFMNTKEFARFMGVERHSTRRFIKTAVKVDRRRYFIPDLAEDLMNI